MMSLRRQIKSRLFPLLLERNESLLRLVRRLQFALWRAGRWLQSLRGQIDTSNAIIWVDPQQVTEYIGDLPWSRYGMLGRIVDGDWDKKAMPFRGWDLYKAMQARFLRGESWTDTPFYERVSSRIEAGNVRWGCATVAEFEQRLARLEKLYHDIATTGYKSQEELSASQEDPHAWERDSPFRRYDEVIVCINRDGRFLLRDGKHRLSIAKIQNLERMPVAVGLRHAQWDRFKKDLARLAGSYGPGSCPAFTHPDLNGLSDETAEALLERITRALPVREGSLLDLSVDFGYFSHHLEKHGFSCTTVAWNGPYRQAVERLRTAEDRTFEVVDPAAAVESPRRYDVVIAVGLTRKCPGVSAEEVRHMLMRTDARAVFVEQRTDEVDRSTDGLGNLVDYIKDNTFRKKATKIGSIAAGRDLYLLEA